MGSSSRNRQGGNRQGAGAANTAPAAPAAPASEPTTSTATTTPDEQGTPPSGQVVNVESTSKVVVDETGKTPVGPAPVLDPASGEPVVNESGATVTVDDEAPGTADPAAAEQVEQERADEVTRADALAKLAGAVDDEPDVEPEPAPEPVMPTGQVLDFVDGNGEAGEFLVLASKVNFWVNGNFRVARKGDVIRLTEKDAKRGLDREFLARV